MLLHATSMERHAMAEIAAEFKQYDTNNRKIPNNISKVGSAYI